MSLEHEILKEIIEKVKENFQIDDVYEEEEIVSYVKENCSVSEVFESSDIIDHVCNNFSPEDVFGDVIYEDFVHCENVDECFWNNNSTLDVFEQCINDLSGVGDYRKASNLVINDSTLMDYIKENCDDYPDEEKIATEVKEEIEKDNILINIQFLNNNSEITLIDKIQEAINALPPNIALDKILDILRGK